jgi:UDP-N-acetylmuramoyl-L-alanyl-D-glutamate--2,6-diaminopimelate ligase
MRLHHLLAALRGHSAADTEDVEVTAITEDSRAVQPGTLFVAVPGTALDGAAFIGDAVARGAVAIVTESAPPAAAPVPVVHVPSARHALAALAAGFYGHPTHDLTVVGFTGTFGKTTTSDVLRTLLEAAGHPTAVLGSLGATFRTSHIATSGLTTPAPIELNRVLRTLADEGARTVIMEVTSHALRLGRVEGVTFQHALLGAIMPGEHTDFHHSYADYVAAKGHLLEYIDPAGVLVFDRDNAAARRLASSAPQARRAGLSLLGLPERAPDDVTLRRVEVDGAGAAFEVRGRPLRSALLGRHNVRNAGLAVTAALALGIDLDVLADALPRLRALHRRMRLTTCKGRRVLDDTSGHPESLAAAFEVAALVPHDRLLVAYAVRGSRGTAINAENGRALGDLALLYEAATPVVTAASDTAGPPNHVSEAEALAARAAIAARGCEYAWHDTLTAAIEHVSAASGAGDLVLLLGAQGMDRGAALLERALERQDTHA